MENYDVIHLIIYWSKKKSEFFLYQLAFFVIIFELYHEIVSSNTKQQFLKCFFFTFFPGLSFAVTVAIVEFCWKTSVAFNSDPQKEINFRQTSPVLQRRNFRRFTSVDRRRSRKSLCAEIGNNDDECLKRI